MGVFQEPRVLHNILTKDECEYLINASKNNLEVSVIGDGFIKKVRLSDSHIRNDNKEDNIVYRVVQRIATIMSQPMEAIEPLQVTRYKKDGFYLPHVDVDISEDGPINNCRGRFITCIIALNDDYEGGKTNFPLLGKSYRIPRGGMLVFRSTDSDGYLDVKSRHEGQIVTKGEKWIATIWMHGKCILKGKREFYLSYQNEFE
jgi:prolyl 4-hydroxylase